MALRSPFKTWKPRRGGAENWREPTQAEAVVYVITDGADTPPALAKIDVLAIGFADTRVATTRSAAQADLPHISQGADYTIITYDDADFTPAAAWARYIGRQESIVEDLKREVETREKWRAFALTEHVKVGPSGPPVAAAASEPPKRHKHDWQKSADGDRRICACGADQPRCRVCGGNRDTCGHFVGAGAL